MERDSNKGKDVLIYLHSFLLEEVQVSCKIRIITKHKSVIEVTKLRTAVVNNVSEISSVSKLELQIADLRGKLDKQEEAMGV
jgi:hypothetical protein